MPTSPYYYVQQSDIESYLDVVLTGNGQNVFTLLQPALQDAVDKYCNRSWNFTNPITENFDAMALNGELLYSNYQFFPKYPISQTVFDSNFPGAQGIQSFTIGNVSVDMRYVFSYGTFIKLSASFPSVLLSNPLGFKAVQVTYSSDDAQNVPALVKMALIQWIARMINTSSDAGKDTKEVMAGNIRAYYKEDKFEIPDFVRIALNPFRLTPIDRL